jgi:thiol-disulfide isomerase/thioredoxin
MRSLTLLALLSLSLSAQQTPRPAPPLTYSLPNKPNQTLDPYRGKVIALEFIFTTCPHCQAASHLMSKLQTEYGPRGLQVLDVAINPNADLKVEDFAREQQTTFPVGWANQKDMTTFMGFGSDRYVVPQLVLIDRKGVIHYQTPAMESDAWDKLMTEDSIRKHIEELLNYSRPHTRP